MKRHYYAINTRAFMIPDVIRFDSHADRADFIRRHSGWQAIKRACVSFNAYRVKTHDGKFLGGAY